MKGGSQYTFVINIFSSLLDRACVHTGVGAFRVGGSKIRKT